MPNRRRNQLQQSSYRVLTIDDDCVQLKYLKQMLLAVNIFEVEQADSAEKGIILLKEAVGDSDSPPFDAILLDISMPGMSGIEACRVIKTTPTIHNIPIIMVTSASDAKTLEQAFFWGASDYVTKPFSRVELVARLKSVCRENQSTQELKRLALYDSLTGLANRTLLEERLEQAEARSKRKGTQYAVLYFDLDKFKALNDELGHDMGDLALAEVASRLKSRVREMDTVARIGGDEFIVLLSDIEGQVEVENKAQQLINGICEPIDCDGTVRQLGASVGVAIISKPDMAFSKILKVADSAMYRAKENGGNSFSVHQFRL